MTHFHVFPIDASLTPEEAWREQCLMGVRATNTGSERWGVVKCDDGDDECRNIAEAVHAD